MRLDEVNKKDVVKYFTLPRIVPRFKALFSSGFAHVSFFLAQLYSALGILPKHHPYLNPVNMGRYGVHNVVMQAGSNIQFKKENLDHVFIFGITIIGLMILFMQLCLLGFTIFVGAASAGTVLPDLPTSFAGFFGTPNPTNDVAFVLLDRVFGIPDLFNSCVAQNIPCFEFAYVNPAEATSDGIFPWPFHTALRSLFQFYSIGMLVIAMIIFLYFVVAIAVETAQSGTPFGRRFNHVWAPIRLVVALGLLIPISNGLNSGQYIALYAAKYGSGFATNGWNRFLGQTTGASQITPENIADAPERLIATPKPPPLTNIIEFATVVQTCKAAHEEFFANELRSDYTLSYFNEVEIRSYLVKSTREADVPRLLLSETSYEDALAFYDYGDITVVFGDYDETADEVIATDPGDTAGGERNQRDYRDYKGFVKPFCGEITLQITDVSEPGATHMQRTYYEIIQRMFRDEFDDPDTFGFPAPFPTWGQAFAQDEFPDIEIQGYEHGDTYGFYDKPDSYHINFVEDAVEEAIRNAVNEAVTLQVASASFVGDSAQLGWGGASIWYNKIAQINGSVVGAAYALPFISQYPLTMEYVANERAKNDSTVAGRNAFNPVFSEEKSFSEEFVGQTKIAITMWNAYSAWDDIYPPPAGSDFANAITTFFGLDGLFSIRENKNVHPLAQLSTIGKSLVESSIRNFGFALGTGVGGGVAAVLGMNKVGAAFDTSSDFFFSIGMLGLGVGFILFYILPFFPFIYFFFAVGGWVKGIFEAMVGIPLWALAHIRIDGDGLPGSAALSGYYLILEIFLRPIFIVFGLIASLLTFSAQVHILNDIWDLVVENVAGFDTERANEEIASEADGGGLLDELETLTIAVRRDVVDQFFYTIIYTIMVYLVAMASFKLVDLIPNFILRWMGANVSTFGDQNNDPTESLVRNTYISTNVVGGQLQGAAGGARTAAQGTGQGIGAIMGRGGQQQS